MMTMIAPMVVGPEQMTSATAPENDAPAWSASAAIPAGERRVHENAVWEAITASTGSRPREGSKDWVRVSATNRWKAFDQQLHHRSEQAERLGWTIQLRGTVNCVAFLKPEGSTARVILRDANGAVVARQEAPIASTANVRTLHDFFFGERQPVTDLIFGDLPAARVGSVQIDILAPAGRARVAQVVIGRLEYLGETGVGTEVGYQTYSRFEPDDFGVVRIVRRRAARLANYRLGIQSGDEERVLRLLERQDARPAVFSATGPDGKPLGGGIYGLAKPLRITAGVGLSTATLTVEGFV